MSEPTAQQDGRAPESGICDNCGKTVPLEQLRPNLSQTMRLCWECFDLYLEMVEEDMAGVE
ncbi:MAG: hypothetical protein HYV08_02690 [Deltaproteobacteria bacterium]|nr:hypothetical protein [Deltaproteobacteria bacterium]MBI3078334.1 hypothetical protein [Deltaproteobacteria bacterium]